MNTIKQPIFLVVGIMITSFVLASCQDLSITSDSEIPVELDTVEVGPIESGDFLNPESITPNIEELDLEDFFVENSTELKPVMTSAGNTSSKGYFIIDLGTLSGGHHSFGTGINNSSQAVGHGQTSLGNRAFLWEDNSIQYIGTLDPSSRLGSMGEDVNNHGQLVGRSYASNSYYPFLWDATDGMQDLGSLTNGSDSFATGVNDQGQVAGYYRYSSGTRGFIWDATGGIQDLGSMKGSNHVTPVAINKHGTVVGYFYTGSSYHVFTWNATDGFKDLRTLGVAPSSTWHSVIAQDINDLGQIAGYAANLSGHSRGGFIWDPNTGFQSLGSVSGAGSNSYSYAFGLNNKGQVTGYFIDYKNNGRRAFVWDATKGMQDLGVLDQNNTRYYNYSIGSDINDKGEIIGYSLNKHRLFRAVLWKNLVTNNSPIADAGPDQTVECAGDLTSATLDGSNSSDPDDDSLTYSWSMDGSEIATGVAPVVELSCGTHTIALTVNDPDGETDSDKVVINVVDTTPPDLAYTVENSELWPPNHKMKIVVSGISITDICDQNPVLAIGVTSNEAVNGQGDGNTDPDWNIVDNGDDYDVYVRAEFGSGDGRIYTITFTGTDTSGNIAEEILKISVPQSNGRSR